MNRYTPLLAALVLATPALAGSPLKGADVKLGKGGATDAKTASPSVTSGAPVKALKTKAATPCVPTGSSPCHSAPASPIR